MGGGEWGVALFLSTAVNKIDKKGRVSVPAAWRAAVLGQSFPGIIVFRSFKLEALEGCDVERMTEMSQRLDTLDQFSEEHESLASIFADAQQLAFDGEGRIVLPEFLIQHAGIGETAAFVGQGRTFQIWEPRRWQDHSEALRTRMKQKGATLPGQRPAAGAAS
jgi:MraZ protein